MALSEIELKRIEADMGKFMNKHRPPPHIRKELDLGYRIDGHSVELFEIRPVWKDPARSMESPVAKATFVRARGVWKIFWQRADLRWHSYEPTPIVKTIEQFLFIVECDEHACFFG